MHRRTCLSHARKGRYQSRSNGDLISEFVCPPFIVGSVLVAARSRVYIAVDVEIIEPIDRAENQNGKICSWRII